MKQLTTRQMILLGVMMEGNIALVHAPSQAGEYARQHAYLTPLVAAVVLSISIWALLRVRRRFPEQDLFEAMVSRFPISGRLLLFLYVLFFLVVFARDLRIISDLINVTLLPLTPVVAISLLILLTVVFMIKGGLNSVVGMAEIFIPVLLLALFSMPLLFGQNMDFSAVKPMLYFNLKGIGEGSWTMLSYLGDIVVLPFVISGNNYSARSAWGGLLLGTIFMMVQVVLSQLVIGLPIMSRLVYPSYEMARQLQLTDFLDRFDLFVAALMLPATFVKIGFDLFVICMGMKRLLPKGLGNLMVWPVGLFGFVCSFWFFSNVTEIYEFSRGWTVIVIIFTVLIPLLLLLMLRPKRKKELPEKAGEETGDPVSAQ